MPTGIHSRWASAENWDGIKGQGGKDNNGRKGTPCFKFPAGESKVLAHAENTSGTVRRIWATINDRSPEMMRGIHIDMYWDGASKPAVSAPLGDFFGQGLGRCTTFESEFFSNPECRSFNCNIPMPFRTGMKIEVTNESKKDLKMFFYDVNYTIGDDHDENTLYFHAHWRRENPTQMKKDYEFLPKVSGKGRFLGLNGGVIADTDKYFDAWWGEGECKVYLDGDDKYPTLCGTGTEDYIGTAWGQGQYAHRYQGCHLADRENMQFLFYRFHVPDPIYFYQDIMVTMHQIGYFGGDNLEKMRDAGTKLVTNQGEELDMDKAVKEGRRGLFERQDDWSSCAYFYLDRPANELPGLPEVKERTIGLFNPEDTEKRADV